MAPRFNLTFAPNGLQRWLAPGVFILIVVLAGLALPQVMPNTTAVPQIPSANAASGQEMWMDSTTPLPEGPDARAMLTRLALGTVLVLGLCVGTLWVGKRWLQVKPLPPGGTRQLRVVEALPLNGRCCVYLLQAGSRQVLAGIDGYGLKVLLPLTDSFEHTLSQAQAREPEIQNP